MGLLHVAFVLLFAIAAQSARIPTKRDTYDPNKLMKNYMGMRTDQTSFGSFHPNDLIDTIQNYFRNGGNQLLPNNQWGLSVYNPNEAIEQYVGELNSPGALGPETEDHEEVASQENQNRLSQMTGFNPDELNKMLLNSVDGGNTFSVDSAKNQGFDADALNKQLMDDINNSQQVDTVSTGNGQNTQSGSGASTQNPNQQNDGFGFNPNQLNANLLNGLEYDPNSAMSAMNNLQSNTGNAASGSTSGPTPSSGNSGSLSNGGSTTGTNGASGSSNMSGNNAGAGQLGGSNFSGGNIGTQSGSSATGNNGGAGTSNFNAGGLGNLSGGNIGTQSGSSPSGNNGGVGIGGFNAGSLGPGGSSSNGQGVPPGVSTGSDTLQQTSVDIPAPSGIGGMGGKLN